MSSSSCCRTSRFFSTRAHAQQRCFSSTQTPSDTPRCAHRLMTSRVSGRSRSTSSARRPSSSSSRRATSAPRRASSSHPASTTPWPYLTPLPRHRTASERSARRSRRTSRSSSSKKRTLKRAAGRSRRCATSAPRTCSRPSLTTTGRSRFGIASMSFSSSPSRSSPRRRRPQPAAPQSSLSPDRLHLNHPRRCSSARPTI